MADWSTIASLASAGGTLALAVATFSATRLARRSTELAEFTLQEQLRPVVVNSRLDDPVQKIMFVDRHWVSVSGSEAAAEEENGVVYLVASLRNVGTGIAVLRGWYPWADVETVVGEQRDRHADPEEFRPQTRDLLVPPGDIGLFQGALRDAAEPIHRELTAAITARRAVAVDLLYSNQIGRQSSISRFMLTPGTDRWIASVSRHWSLDRPALR